MTLPKAGTHTPLRRIGPRAVDAALASSPADVLTLIECDSCNRRIEAPRDEYLACGAVEEWLEEEGWCLRGYLAYCPTCVRLWPVCDSCDQSTHPREIADHNPPVVCMACAQWDDDQRPDDDGELVAAFGSQAVFGVGR